MKAPLSNSNEVRTLGLVGSGIDAPKPITSTADRHLVRTVVEAGWSGVKNGKLLALAATEFDAFITVGKNLPFQQTQSLCRTD